MAPNPLIEGMLDTIRIVTSVYAVIALIIALVLLVMMTVEMFTDREGWDRFTDELWERNTSPGMVLVLLALGWPIVLFSMIREADGAR